MRVQNKVELKKNYDLEKIADSHELEIEKIWEPHGLGVFTGNQINQGTEYLGFPEEHVALAEVKFTDGESVYVVVDVTDGKAVSEFPHSLSRGWDSKRTVIQDDANVVAQYFKGNEFHVDGINLKEGRTVWSFKGNVDERRRREQANMVVTPELTYVVAKGRVAAYDKEGNIALEKRVRRNVKGALIHPSGQVLFVEERKKKEQHGMERKSPGAFLLQTSDGSTHRVSLDSLTRGCYSLDSDLPDMAMIGNYVVTVDEGGSFNAYKFPSMKHVGHTLVEDSLRHLTYGGNMVNQGRALLIRDSGEREGVMLLDLEDKEDLINRSVGSRFDNQAYSMQVVNDNLVLIDDKHIDVYNRVDRILTSAFDFKPNTRYDNVQGVGKLLVDTDGALYPIFQGALGKITGKRHAVTYKATQNRSALDSKEIAKASR